MPRLPTLTTRESIAPEAHAAFDSIVASRGRVGGPFAILMHSPEVAARTAHLGAHVRFASALLDVDRELATITAAREMRCGYEWHAHLQYARERGVREEAVAAVAERRPLDAFTAAEALVVGFARGLLREHRIPDATFDAALARYGQRGLVELCATVGYYAMLACTLNAAAVEPTDDAGWA